MSVRRAARLFEDFTGMAGRDAVPFDFRAPAEGEALVYIGSVVAIAYEANRDKRTDHYEHEFRKSSRPVLAASSDGSRLYLLAGKYKFTARGIEDR